MGRSNLQGKNEEILKFCASREYGRNTKAGRSHVEILLLENDKTGAESKMNGEKSEIQAYNATASYLYRGGVFSCFLGLKIQENIEKLIRAVHRNH